MKKKLPISCLCSIYKKTILEEFIISIDSLLNQEYIPDEILIIVDGLITRELELFINFLKNKNEIFKILVLKENKGLGFALKYGLNKCHNDIVARFDTDDINLKGRLKFQYDFLIKNPIYSLVGSNIIEFNPKEERIILKKLNSNINSKFNLYMIRNPINHPTVMFKKEKIINIGSYKDIKHFEDYELWLRCLKNGLLMHNFQEPMVAMRRDNYCSKRIGFRYALCEIKFLKETIKQKTLNKIFIPIFIIRIIIRILPNKISNLLLFIDFKRDYKNYNFNIETYKNKISNKNNSISKGFNLGSLNK